jgi:hypothetical protein
MAPIKSQKSGSNRADAGSHICDSCGTSIRNRGKKQHKCKGNGGTSLGDVFKEMAEEEALERGMFSIFNAITVNKLSSTARQLSLMANEPNTDNRGQSSRSECIIEIEPIPLLSKFEVFFFSDIRRFGLVGDATFPDARGI